MVRHDAVQRDAGVPLRQHAARQPTLRSDGIKNVDFSLFKNNRFNDGKWNAQIRIEAFNVLNRTRFNAPNTAVDSARLRHDQRRAGGRQVQIGLKLLF